MLYAFIMSPICITRPANRIVIDLITLIILYEKQKLSNLPQPTAELCTGTIYINALPGRLTIQGTHTPSSRAE
jgi:hypothetical protein